MKGFHNYLKDVLLVCESMKMRELKKNYYLQGLNLICANPNAKVYPMVKSNFKCKIKVIILDILCVSEFNGFTHLS